MKALKIIKYVFTIVGALMLIGTFFILKNTSSFLTTSIDAEGIVTEMVRSRSSSSSDNTIMYAPIIEFKDEKGNVHEFKSSTSSSSPSYSIGEKVPILYNPTSPNKAKIKSFFSLWGGGMILGILGLVFFSIGFAFFFVDKRKKKLLQNLKLNGKRIDTDFKSVDINYSYAVNNRNPYQIVSQWQNPATSKIHIFTSDNIWFDPTEYIEGNTIKVLIDKNDPKKYAVDLSFLPETA